MSNTQVESGYADKAGKGIHNQHNRRVIGDVLSYILLTVLGIIWLLPIVWVFLESFNQNSSSYQRTFFPCAKTAATIVNRLPAMASGKAKKRLNGESVFSRRIAMKKMGMYSA